MLLEVDGGSSVDSCLDVCGGEVFAVAVDSPRLSLHCVLTCRQPFPY